MARKHFEAIAEALKAAMPNIGRIDAYRQWEKDCRAMADTLAKFNWSFKRETFLSACGL